MIKFKAATNRQDAPALLISSAAPYSHADERKALPPIPELQIE
jgi:hypothetical protein